MKIEDIRNHLDRASNTPEDLRDILYSIISYLEDHEIIPDQLFEKVDSKLIARKVSEHIKQSSSDRRLSPDYFGTPEYKKRQSETIDTIVEAAESRKKNEL